ncbi:iron-siderophore ABC transporter substrate-binding protein [Actinoplanes sp. LDG1-06]|uniref:Iron-siderophore ABC transporter substrate-binding protein n=1 Tax=Paractinoplanes ovalisporus TaxID=2810368 RepID=A0ABS2ABC9_9ACTN|nr:iron-siderophore ABC transporter substrate-binding protein [Actinoplanes ovalisporus]MBM2616688.1 iron-siderophore ABC transporter substrate-binding protein [Actinoplanes ovalisporus]
MSFSIRASAAGAALVVGLALLSGCGGDDGEAASPSGSGAPAEAAFPVTLTHKLGTAEVKAAPQRVVALSDADLDALLVLGVQPVGIAESAGEGGVTAWAKPLLTGSPTVLTAGDSGFDVEKIAALAPDLILAGGDYYIDDEYAKLSKLAPTTAYETTGAFEDPWQTTLKQVGQAVGQSAKAEQVITEVEGKVAKAKTDNPDLAGKEFTLSQMWEAGSIGVLRSDKDAGVKMLNDFGMKLAPGVAALKGDDFAVQLSLEKVGVLDADTTLIYYADKSLQPALEGNTLFKNLASVKRGSYKALADAQFSALRTPTPLSVQYIITDVLPTISEAAKAGS